MVKKVGLIILVFLCGCTPGLYRNTFVISGTYLQVVSPYREAAPLVYKEFQRLDSIFNIYRSDSEVSRLNRTYNRPVKVSPELLELLELSKEVYKMSGGYFDVSKGELYSFWKEIIQKGKIKKFPDNKTIKELISSGGMEFVELDKTKSTVTLKKRGIKLDFSGIAKGYMVDKAVMRLKEHGVRSALVNAGGDIYCMGTNKGKIWEVGIRNPFRKGGIIDEVRLKNQAVATSGSYEQFVQFGGRRLSHIINPLTGQPVDNGVVSVTVVAKNCTTADSLATAFFCMGPDGVRKFIMSSPSNLRIYLVYEKDGKRRIYIF